MSENAQYDLVIKQDGESILTRPMTADEVIDAMRGKAVTFTLGSPAVLDREKTAKKEIKITKRDGSVGTVAAAPNKTTKRKKGERICKICGTPGHMAKTCPKGNSRGLPSARTRLEQQAESPLSDELKERIQDMRDRDMTTTEISRDLAAELDWDVDETKREVEKVMSRHAQRVNETRSGTEAMELDQYKVLRGAMHDRDFSSAQYALSHKIPPKEVNAAVRSKNYDDYLENR